jgi:hypothetical protein
LADVPSVASGELVIDAAVDTPPSATKSASIATTIAGDTRTRRATKRFTVFSPLIWWDTIRPKTGVCADFFPFPIGRSAY